MIDLEQKYTELLTLIRNLSNEHVPKEYSDILQATTILKDLTKSIWEAKHFDLLQDLEMLTGNTYHDIQQFWFECLNYPYKFPIKKDVHGEIRSRNYYNLPSDFNEIGFHDSKVIDIKVARDIEMIIDHIEEWEEEEKGWQQIGKRKKLLFLNGSISAQTYLKDRTKQDIEISSIDFPKHDILDFWELPAIKYFQNIEGISCDYRKRVFKMESTAEGYTQIIIISDSWQVETISNDLHAINYAFKVNK
jgi:hypothetical protein